MTFLFVGGAVLVVLVILGIKGGAQNRREAQARIDRHREIGSSGTVIRMKVTVLTRKGQEVFGVGIGATEEEAKADAVKGMTRYLRSRGDSFYSLTAASRVE